MSARNGPLSSNLPEDIIASIIEQTDDTPTLDSWCIAASFNNSLLRVALRRRWRSVTLTHLDMIRNPARRFGLSRRYQAEEGLVNRLITPCSSLLSSTPAFYIKDLMLDFTFVLPPDRKRNGVTQFTPQHYIETAYLTDLEYSMKKLLQQASCLERIIHRGAFSEELLRLVTNYGTKSLAVFHAQSTHRGFERFLTQDEANHVFNAPRSIVNWHRLQQLKTLRELQINALPSVEAQSLSRAVRKLCVLQRLSVSPGSLSNWDHSTGMKSCSVMVFLEGIFPPTGDSLSAHSGLCGIPRTLQVLELTGTWHDVG